MSNRLEKEDSPYLQQHKENPVEWYPWCDEAFEKTQSENIPIDTLKWLKWANQHL